LAPAGVAFDLRLTGPPGAEVTLRAPDLHRTLPLAGGTEVYLFDPSTARFYDLRAETARVTLPTASSAGGHALEVLVGPSSFIDARKAAELPTRFTVEPPYPNPLTRQATLPYTVPRGSDPVDVEITIYNVLGQVVQRAAQTRRGPGRHFFRWDTGASGRPLASGVYFARLAVEGRSIGTQKLVLVR